MSCNYPLVVIVGPTASGKTKLAIELAKKHNGEIISADSRAIYKGLDIGTAKPTIEEMDGIAHYGIDIVDPGVRFTAFDFKKYANEKIDEIRKRNKVPFLVGGTGLYVDAVLYDFSFSERSNDLERREELEKLTKKQLIEKIQSSDLTLPKNQQNKRHLISTILRGGEQIKNTTLINNVIIVGISTDKEMLRERIEKRSDDFFTSGVIEEAIAAAEKYGWNNEAMTGNIYPLIKEYIAGNMLLDDMKKRFIVLDWRLAKRQLTWLRRNKNIKWMSIDEAYKYIDHELIKIIHA